MFRNARIPLAGAAGVLSLSAIAFAAEPTASELREQIEALNAKVAKIEAREASASQQQSTVANVLNDAERRSQLLQSGGVTAGYDNGFFIGSADGKFKFSPYLIFQFRSITNYGDDTRESGDDSIENGFEVRRFKAGAKGTAFAKELTYDFRFTVGRTGTTSIDLAYVAYQFADDWSVKIGQYKANVFHEETISDNRQLAVERSLVNALIGGGQTDYVQGVALTYKTEALRAEIGLTDGANSDNTTFLDGEGGTNVVVDPNYGVDGRVEYKLNGDWKSYDDFTSLKNKTDLLVLGAGFDYTEGGDTRSAAHSIDLQWESGPINAYAAYIGRWNDLDGEDGYDWGALAQAGYAVDANWEVFGRYSFTDVDDGDNYSEITVGANYYFYGHNVKATVDVNVLPDGSPDLGGLGYLAGDDLQIVVRGQLQFAL